MGRPSLLTDDLVRQLVAAGQVDILVGLPTFNHAATVEAIVRSLHVGLARYFPRERTVLIHVDGGSDDGTLELVRNAPMSLEELRGSPLLRTTHRISGRYTGLPGRVTGTRTVFAAADLLQARAVVLLDPDLTSMTSDWVAELARPVWRDEADLVLPIHARHRFEGPLLSQLVRPLLQTAFGYPLRASLTGDFACSGRFAARMVRHGVWDRDPGEATMHIEILATAMAEELRLAQVHLGPRLVADRGARPRLGELFEQVVGGTFGALEAHGAVWPGRDERRPAEVVGRPVEGQDREAEWDLASLAERFRSGVRDLAPLLRDIVGAETLARLQAAAASTDEPPRMPDGLWVTTVYEFAAAAHRGVMSRDHVTRALLPIYLGRTAAFLAGLAADAEPAYTQRLELLEGEFAERRPYFVQRWNAGSGR